MFKKNVKVADILYNSRWSLPAGENKDLQEIAYSKKNHSIRLVSIIKREKPAPKGHKRKPVNVW